MRRRLLALAFTPAAALGVVLALGALPLARADQAVPAQPAIGANDLDRLVERYDAETRAVEAELAQVGPSLETIHRRMLARGRAYYRLVRAGLLPAGGGFDGLVDHAAKVERTRLALERDVSAETALGRRRESLETHLARLRVERAPLDVQREAMSRARTALAEADERRAAFARAFDSSAHPGSLAVYGADTGPADPDAPRQGFRALKGRLPFPVAGRAEVHRVTRHGGYGLELVAAPGAPVRSVAGARVVFADRNEDYGLAVILDHGDHFFTVYGSLGSTEVHAGETVAPGTRLGTVGEGSGHRTMLYFEVRRNADGLDPAVWLGI